ncbi:MAG: hypothetical protein AAF609_01955 [Cyanobacteria bacterium P01_C01_bin.120]
MPVRNVIPKVSRLLLIGLGAGALLISTPRLAQSQTAGINRQAMRELNLSFSQMQQMRGVMQSYQSELEEILTSEQLEQLEALKAEQQEQPSVDARPDLAVELDLSTEQASQLDALQEDMTAELQEILSDEQLEQMQELGLTGL